MFKTIFSVTFLLFFLIGGYFFLKLPPDNFANNYCAFCNPTILNNQTFYEDNLVLALYTHRPIFPGHCLIVSKRHVERFEELTEAEITQIGRVIKKVNEAVVQLFGTTSYLLAQKNGTEVGQSVPHVHFHYIPRKAGDDSSVKFIWRMWMSNLTQPTSQEEMREVVEKLRKATSEQTFLL